MDEAFRSLICQLWARLGLPAPRFTEVGRVQLRVEDTPVDLRDNQRGLLLIEGEAGRFSPDIGIRAKQIREVLAHTPGLLLGSHAGVWMKHQPKGTPVLAVRATHALSSGRLEDLVRKVEDVANAIEFHAAGLRQAQPRHREPKAAAATASHSEPSLIFKP